MQVLWLPESWPWPIPALLRLLRRPACGGSRLQITLLSPQALGALTIHGENGEVLLRLADQLATRSKVFRLPPLPENENLTLRDMDGNVLHEKIVHLKDANKGITAPSLEAAAADKAVSPTTAPQNIIDDAVQTMAPSSAETERQVTL